MAGVRPVNSVGVFETRPLGARPSAVPHPVDTGSPVDLVVPLKTATPPLGHMVNSTGLWASAEVRDGVANFRAVGTVPVAGTRALDSLTQTADEQKLKTSGSYDLLSQPMDLQNFIHD
ncbi:MAG: hypothetical protein JOZ39_09210 [Chloroflexi bacterium]|nr:hypothetical protein [Chloroflexota bacterium]